MRAGVVGQRADELGPQRWGDVVAHALDHEQLGIGDDLGGLAQEAQHRRAGDVRAMTVEVEWQIVIPDEIGELKETLKVFDLQNIQFNTEEQKRIHELLPKTKVTMPPSCNCKD